MLICSYHFLVLHGQPGCDEDFAHEDDFGSIEEDMGKGDTGKGDMEDIHEEGMASGVDTSCLGRAGMDQQGMA